MKALFIVLIVVSASIAGHLKFWDYGDLLYEGTIYPVNYVMLYGTEVETIDYIWLYASDEGDLNNAQVAMVTPNYYVPNPEDYFDITHDAEPCEYGYRMQVDLDYSFAPNDVRMLYVKVPSGSVRATTPQSRTIYPTGPSSWMPRDYEASVVFIGQVVALDRITWAEIKTAF
ncbi:MAG: hypothetical protein K8S62_06450 [Candidatus Sabulitectum sp.]|nr:hypothetical protein [Candidatus Sabulitectum sp.]